MGLSADVTFPEDSGCLSTQLSPVTFESKLYLSKFVDKLEKQGSASNHSLGFHRAFRIMWNTLTDGGKRSENGESLVLPRASPVFSTPG